MYFRTKSEFTRIYLLVLNNKSTGEPAQLKVTIEQKFITELGGEF
jgi:hypothetical protein